MLGVWGMLAVRLLRQTVAIDEIIKINSRLSRLSTSQYTETDGCDMKTAATAVWGRGAGAFAR